jgi:hypothetical protein
MRDAAGFHDRFAVALRDGDAGPLLAELDDPAALARFAVYRNNVVRGAIEALRAAYPAVNRLVGDSFFSAMAELFWQANPPRERTMTFYGDRFAAHIDTYSPASGLPYLGDVARHDQAWLRSHHSADEAPLEPARITALNPEVIPGLRPGLHTSVQILHSIWPAHEIWAGNRFATEPPKLALNRAERNSIVWRQNGEVRHRAIDAATAKFLLALEDGQSLEVAAGMMTSINPHSDPFELFRQALSDGLLGSNI